MQYKILALDLDGTLTNTDKIITPRTKAALQAAAQKGVCIVLASGRPTVGIEPLAKELELEKYGGCILSYNGGKIIDCKTGETLVQYAFPADLIEPVCTFSRYWNVVPLTYDRNGIVTEDPASPYVQEEARINRIPVRQVENLPAEVTYPINKLLLTGDPADMPHVEELMQQELKHCSDQIASTDLSLSTLKELILTPNADPDANSNTSAGAEKPVASDCRGIPLG